MTDLDGIINTVSEDYRIQNVFANRILTQDDNKFKD